MRLLHRLAVLAGAAASIAGCGDARTTDSAAGATGNPPASPPDRRGERVAVALIDALERCVVDHRGLLIDLGTTPPLGGHALAGPSTRALPTATHSGATWAQLFEHELRVTFYHAEPSPVFVAVRATADQARRASVAIDDVPLGTLNVPAGPARIVSTQTSRVPLGSGLHELVIRFSGKKGTAPEPYAELDWVRIGVPDELTRTYGAPTVADMLMPAAELGKVPRRALAVRAPTTIACSVRVPPQARLRASVGIRGEGNAKLAVYVRGDLEGRRQLARLEVSGGADSRWADLDVGLADLAGEVGRLELAAEETTGTGRLLVGDPVIVVPERTETPVPRARSAVVVVLNGVERTDLPPWRDTPSPHAPNLRRLADSATVFDAHRAPTTNITGAVATLVSGQSPRIHSVLDTGSRVPKSLVGVGDLARHGSVRASMFTGVPPTFGVFGFEPHWEAFTAYPPNEGRAATAPLDEAALWLTEPSAKPNEDRPMLAVVHLRGGHPPWDITPDEADRLPPKNYTGAVRPRDSAQAVASLGGKFSRLDAPDEERMRSMFFAALHGQDAALGDLVRKLEDAGRWDSTLLIVTGDVASARSTLFADAQPLSEARLTVPLYVRFPGGTQAGQRVARPTEAADLTRTLLLSLGLEPPPDLGGRDLANVAAGADDPERLAVAYVEDAFSARWGRFVLHGRVDDRRPSLCDVMLDPSCRYDRGQELPITAEAFLRRFVQHVDALPAPLAREAVTVDTESAAALKVWGL